MKKITYLLIVLSLLFLSCNTYQRHLGKFQAFALQHEAELAKLCSTVFPVKDSVGSTVIDHVADPHNVDYRKQVDSLKALSDALTDRLKKDTVKSNPCADIVKGYQKQIAVLNGKITALQVAYRPCKPDTVYRTKTIYRTDEAKLMAMQSKYNISHDSLLTTKVHLTDTKSQSANRLRWLFILGGVILLMLVAFYFLNKFIKLNI